MTIDELRAELKGLELSRTVKVRFVRDPAIDETTLYDIGIVATDEEPVILEAFSDIPEER